MLIREHGKDSRFKAVDKTRDREGNFNDFIMELRKREKDEREEKKKNAKKEFKSLLRDTEEIDRHSHWSDVKKIIQDDSR